MDELGHRYHPAAMEIRHEDLRASLLNLRHYLRGRRDLWYTVINQHDISPPWVDAALATLSF